MVDVAGTLSNIDNLINLWKRVMPLLTPQYKDAAKDLYKVTDYILSANQLLVSWVSEFKKINLADPSKKEFDEFKDKYNMFRIGTDYDKVKVHCTTLSAIYKKSLKSNLQRLFVRDKAKLSETDLIFERFANQEDNMSKLVFGEILGGLETAIALINSDYDDAEKYRIDYVDIIDFTMSTLTKQIDELREQRLKLIELSGAEVSND